MRLSVVLLYPILVKQQIIAYFRYVDNILIIYGQNKTNIDLAHYEFNELQPTINFTIEKEEHKSINFLDLVIYWNDKNLQFSIYQKPTKTDIVIPNSSCHPYVHKMSGINYLLNRLHTYPVTEKAKNAKKNIIKNILPNNEYDTNLIRKLPTQKKQQLNTCTNLQGNKRNCKAFSRHENKSGLLYAKYYTKYIKATATDR
jgi:hypothetical protein